MRDEWKRREKKEKQRKHVRLNSNHKYVDGTCVTIKGNK